MKIEKVEDDLAPFCRITLTRAEAMILAEWLQTNVGSLSPLISVIRNEVIKLLEKGAS